jgi:Sec-independent protein secretion pathway component TatC
VSGPYRNRSIRFSPVDISSRVEIYIPAALIIIMPIIGFKIKRFITCSLFTNKKNLTIEPDFCQMEKFNKTLYR